MNNLKVGNTVFWIDPDNDSRSCEGEITSIDGDIIWLKTKDGWDVQVSRSQLIPDNTQQASFYSENIKAFKAIEIHPVCYLNKSENDKQLAEQCEEHEADFYSVYIVLCVGGLECIADCQTKAIAESLAALLNKLIRHFAPFTEAKEEIIHPVSAYYNAVVDYLKEAYGLTPGDINLTEETAAQLQQEGVTPVLFIDHLAEKHNLTKNSDFTAEQAAAFMKRFKSNL